MIKCDLHLQNVYLDFDLALFSGTMMHKTLHISKKLKFHGSSFVDFFTLSISLTF